MVSTAAMSKTNRKTFSWLIARRKRLATWTLLVACACLSPWPHGASALNLYRGFDHRAGTFNGSPSDVRAPVRNCRVWSNARNLCRSIIGTFRGNRCLQQCQSVSMSANPAGLAVVAELISAA
jgi:hypothetical protein